MQNYQIPQIIPGAGRQAADIRTPGAGYAAQFIEDVKYRFQAVANVPGDLNCRLKILTVAIQVIINASVGGLPVGDISPGW